MSMAMYYVEHPDDERRPVMLNEREVYFLCEAKIHEFREEWGNQIEFYIAHVVLGDLNCDLASIQASLKDIEEDRFVSHEDLPEGAIEATVALFDELVSLWKQFYQMSDTEGGDNAEREDTGV